MEKLLGKTVQLYITGLCNMKCHHCNTPRNIPNMTLETFKEAIKWSLANGADRIELFANDPLLHPDIEKMVEMLNKSRLGYAILTVGDSPHDEETFRKFLKLADKIDKKKGAFVFSVDFTEETSRKILKNDRDVNYPFAFKAETFWVKLAPILLKKKIPVRTNTVISRNNVDEVVLIINRVIEMGFTASFCYIQVRQPEFDRLCSKGLMPILESRFRKFMIDSELLKGFDVEEIIEETKSIVKSGELENNTIFNAFRGKNYSESEISIPRLEKLRKDLSTLKEKFPNRVLPSIKFIEEIGSRGFGCINLLKNKNFPQMKIGTECQMFFCCDLHDKYTSEYSVFKNDEWTIGIFQQMIRINPYIWICMYFNPCDFSVNRVVYDASKRVDDK